MHAALDKDGMITCHETASQPAWRRALERAITDPETLLDCLQLDRALLPAARRATAAFGLRVPRGFVERMRPGDPLDPLLLQVLPLVEELDEIDGYVADPVGDRAAEADRGTLRKYQGRVLLIAGGACAVNCRYCFRREFPYAGHVAATGGWAGALKLIAADPSITEVIVSGGDPLMLSDTVLSRLTDGLQDIPHVLRFRIHTRLPIVLPERIDAGLCDWLASLPWPVSVVVHANHPREINAEVIHAFQRMRQAGAILLNQSVLLKRVNDDADVLATLSHTLFAAGVLPYYLHMLDRVSGAAHFDIPETRALDIIDSLTARLPGYLVPRLVREVPGANSKTALGPISRNGTPEAVPLRRPM